MQVAFHAKTYSVCYILYMTVVMSTSENCKSWKKQSSCVRMHRVTYYNISIAHSQFKTQLETCLARNQTVISTVQHISTQYNLMCHEHGVGNNDSTQF